MGNFLRFVVVSGAGGGISTCVFFSGGVVSHMGLLYRFESLQEMACFGKRCGRTEFITSKAKICVHLILVVFSRGGKEKTYPINMYLPCHKRIIPPVVFCSLAVTRWDSSFIMLLRTLLLAYIRLLLLC